MENEFDYYFIASAGVADAPLLRNDDNLNPDGLDFLDENEETDIEEPVNLCFNSPIPKKPRMVDYHNLPNAVFSQKIYNVLAPMNIAGIQFIPAIINGVKGEQYDNYWIVNYCNCIECFDKGKSVYEIDDFTECWEDIEKLYLDKVALSKIPLSKRLVIMPQETSMFELYHKSVVDAIMAVNPEGVRFLPIEGWYEGIQFENLKY
ncbi:hypothetical protein FACS1894151_01000 [Spirochaetia bacterium]|nr:hypothetical protein FACS1894151_01000 [Spirochaetia bacterium]